MAGDGAASEFTQGHWEETSALEDVVLDTSRTLMSAQPDEFETKLRWTMGTVGTELGADRCGTYQVEPVGSGAKLSLTDEWADEGVEPHGEAARVFDAEGYPWLFERLEGFEDVDASPVSALPAEAAALAELLRSEGVRSATFVPLVVDWSLLGALSFETVGRGRRPDDRELNLARTFCDMVGHALAQTRRERELRRKNDRLEEFASVVSHDLRNPLNVAQASIDLARGEPESGPEHLDRAFEATERMERIVQQVLTLARLGRDIGDTESVAPCALAEEAWESVRTDEATLVTEDATTVDADPHRLREAFENLFRNAIEHGGDDVTVCVGRLADEAGFYVADDGCGIPEDERSRVFEHGHSSTDDGTGLGLSIVSRIVDAHGWEIDVGRSTEDGARFEVRTDPGRESGV